MSVVMIESPYSGHIDRNIRYLALCGYDAALLHDECPYASHGWMTQHPRCKTLFVSDYDAKWDVLTRDAAIEMSQRIRRRCDKTVFYTDLGWSTGMEAARQFCVDNDLPFEERKLDATNLAAQVGFCSKEFITSIIDEGGDYQALLE